MVRTLVYVPCVRFVVRTAGRPSSPVPILPFHVNSGSIDALHACISRRHQQSIPMGRSNLLFASLLGAAAAPALFSDAFSLDRNVVKVGGVVRPRPRQLQRASQQAEESKRKSKHASIQRVPTGGTHSGTSVVASNGARRRSSYLSAGTSTSAEPTSSADPPILGGTEAFESWFASSSVGGKQQPGLRHATFQSDELRGLEYSGSKDRGVVEVPEAVVLRTDYNRNSNDGRPDEGWDARLAVLLVKECVKGEDSDLVG